MQFTENEIRELMSAWQGMQLEGTVSKVELSEGDSEEFIEAWKRDFNEIRTVEVAESEARRLLDFFGRMESVLEERESASEELDRMATR